jgi:hypothetical protein
MSFFNHVKETIHKNKITKEKGKYVGIPMPFERLKEFIPVIDRGQSIGVLAGTGVGKSRFARYLFIYHVYQFYKETGYPVHILFFPLEDSKTKVYKNIICNYLYMKHGVVVSPLELDSKKGKHGLPDFIYEYIEEAENYFEEFEKVVTLIDGMHTPKAIYNFCEKHALSTGKIVPYTVMMDGQPVKQVRYESDIHTVVIIDNMSNLDTDEESPDERRAMVRLAKNYVRERLCNFFNFTVAQILQQDFASERQQYSTTGDLVMGKLEPSLAGVGEAKTMTRSMHLVMTLFDPSRFDILRYPKPPKSDPEMFYDIGVLGNKFRSLKIIKNNDGEVNIKVPLFMHAVPEVFWELPPPKTNELKQIYKEYGSRYVKPTSEESPITFAEDYSEDPPF